MVNIRLRIEFNDIYSTPYYPQSNGIVERFNDTSIPHISKLRHCKNINLNEYLHAIVFAYNSETHKNTVYSPLTLLYGRSLLLPIHMKPSYFSFVKPNDHYQQSKKTSKIYYQSAKNIILQQQVRNQLYYDKH